MNDNIVGFTETFPHRLLASKCSLYRTLSRFSVRYIEHSEQLHAGSKAIKRHPRAREESFGLFTPKEVGVSVVVTNLGVNPYVMRHRWTQREPMENTQNSRERKSWITSELKIF
jgi:hypothetical protein